LVETTSRRPYHSPRRTAAARETREAVLEAARQEFARQGYAAATLADIARAAEVSLATVKLVEPTKARLLSAAIRALLRPDDESVALVDQPRWKAMLAEPDARRLLAAVGDGVAAALERQADLISVLSQAASAEPEAARLEQQGSSSRWSDLRTIVEVLAARNELRADLDVDGATDIMWAFASPQMFVLLVRKRGWDTRRWGRWLGDTLARTLLAGGGSEGPDQGGSG
jgi:AcrR family transcriptional regulator